jgi:hypothetical protein
MTNRTRSGGSLIRICAYALAILGAAACGCKNEPKVKAEHHEPGIWFVHATDPHIFLPDAYDSNDTAKAAAGKKQEELNEKALTGLLSRIRSVPEGDGPPEFLVLTGDLGVDPCPISTVKTEPTPKVTAPKSGVKADTGKATDKACAANEAERQKQIEKLASLLGTSPLKDIYLVAGNNDIAREDPGDDALSYFNKLLDDVQTKIVESKSNVQLHNLTRCYDGKSDASSCVADIAEPYRLIGFPSYSFKNEKGNAADLKAQEKQFDIFRGLLAQASQAHKKVLVLSHVPEIDDPFTLGQDRYGVKEPGKANDAAKDNARSRWSTWNVSKKLLDDWYAALASDAVEAVLAGHLHDSHQEIYRPPYSWSTLTSQRGGFQKLILAPPLAVKKQDNSPIQARGFSLIHLERDRVRPQLYWYNSETHDFTAEQHRDLEEREHQGWWHCPRFIKWAWELDQADTPLTRMAVLLIALLTAFLTVVAIWQIPPADNLLADSAGKTARDKKDTQSAADTSPLGTRFGKTVLAGLGGLAMAEVTKALGDGKQSADSRLFYIVWFILFLFALLVVLNLCRALAEAVRARVVVVYYPLPRTQPPARRRVIHPLAYWILRFFRWLVSLRVPALTFADSFFDLIQGKNKTMSRALADTIIEQQRSIVRVADTIRNDLNDLLDQKVLERQNDRNEDQIMQTIEVEDIQIEGQHVTHVSEITRVPKTKHKAQFHHVRVNISVLSTDQTNVFYISRTPGSPPVAFPKRSMAWVTVFTGSIRWYVSTFLPDAKKTVLFDNTDKTVHDDDKLIMLDTHYQARAGQDYEAFVMLPVPWPQRGFGSGYVKGAIHISFYKDADFQAIWKGVDDLVPKTVDKHELLFYPDSVAKILEDWCDPEVQGALNASTKALGELLHGFDEEIYRNYIEPAQPH